MTIPARIWLVLICLALNGLNAETNTNTIPLLHSTNGTVLLTNAEFRTVGGTNIYFLTGSEYHKFNVWQIAPADLKRCGVSLAKIEAEQVAIAEKKRLAIELQAKKIEQARQQAAAKLLENQKRQAGQAELQKKAEQAVKEDDAYLREYYKTHIVPVPNNGRNGAY